MKKVFCSFGALVILAACGGSGGSSAAGFLASDGSFLEPLEAAEVGTNNFAGTNNGYAYQVGMNDARSEFVTEAVLLDGANLSSPPPSGTAEMTAAYELDTFQFPVTDANGLTGTRLSRSGDMTLVVDFDARTVSGEDNGLALDGTFGTSGQLQGTASFQGMNGGLAGDVGGSQAIGIFNGESVTGVFAGGFIAE